ncbi:MAG: hypothetical protein KGY65_07100 [Candidatus Thermoplasmatota archaeon]|nr:hypothetical protein [Candidatus Thermoplasmatota archaeon]MBS3802497.1 hypothetical protein [Candidatus Thermoplasmatota archaeon]
MDFKKSSDYKSGIDYENILAGHLANMAIYRDKNPRMYASSIETLILMCPMEIREKAQKRMQELKIGGSDYTNLTTETIRLYDELWQYISVLLERQNLIFKTRYIKTYE